MDDPFEIGSVKDAGVCNDAPGDNKKVPTEVPKARRCEYNCGESVVSLQNMGDIPRLSIDLRSQGVGLSLNLLEPSLSQRKVATHSSSP